MDQVQQAADFEVRLRGPLDVGASVAFLGRWGDDGLDRWDGTRLVRTFPAGGRGVAFVCRSVGTLRAPRLRVQVEDPVHARAVKRALLDSFVQASTGLGPLLRTDSVLSELDGRFPGVRPVLQLDLFSALIRAISAQQVNLTWAATTRRRLAEAFGDRHVVGESVVYSLSAERLAAADPAEIRALQFTTRKAEYIVGIAHVAASGRLSRAVLRDLEDEEAIRRLTSVRGIGLWTAEWILARTLGRSRVVAGDLGVRKAVGWAYLGSVLPSEGEVRRTTAHWGAAAGVAQTLLLHGFGAEMRRRLARTDRCKGRPERPAGSRNQRRTGSSSRPPASS